MTESACLALAGAGLGLALAHLLLGWLRLHLPHPKTWGGAFLEAESLRVDGTVVVFALAAALVVGCAFGLLPAWHASRADLLDALKDCRARDGRRPSSPARRIRIDRGAVRPRRRPCDRQRTAVEERGGAPSAGPGFEHASRIVIGVHGGFASVKGLIVRSGRTPAEAEHDASSGSEAFWMAREQFRRALLERASSLPGVLGVTSASDVIMSGGYWLASFRPEPATQDPGECTEGLFTSVDANFFAEMRIPLLARAVLRPRRQARITAGGRRQRGARAEVPARPLGHRPAPAERQASREALVHHRRCRRRHAVDGMDKPPVPHVYEPWSQNRWWWGPTEVVLRANGDPMALVAPLRRELEKSYPDAYILRVHRLGDLVQDSAWRLNYAAQLSAGLAAVSLLLAAIGVYGVLSHAVKERTREIGLRIALGARAKHLRAFIARHVIVAAAVGLLGGLLVSAGMVHSLRALLFGIEPFDAPTFALAGCVLHGVALIAAFVPLRRAVRLEPLTALRHE